MRTAVEKAGKIVDKLYDKYQEDHLKAFRTALKADNPFPVLKQAGIDIEPELEEFREFLAEISEKKIGENPSQTPMKSGVPPEVLAIAKAIEFSDFSKDAMKKAETELLKLIDRFTEKDNAQAVFHAVKLLRLVQKEDVEGIKRFGG